MRLLALVVLAIAFMAFAPSERAHERANYHAPFKECQTDELTASLSGSTIRVTLEQGEKALVGAPTYLNLTHGQQWVTTQVSYRQDQEETRLPAEWVDFRPDSFCLEEGENQRVEVWVSVPHRAEVGLYRGLLEFDVCRENFCAAAGVYLYLTVENG